MKCVTLIYTSFVFCFNKKVLFDAFNNFLSIHGKKVINKRCFALLAAEKSLQLHLAVFFRQNAFCLDAFQVFL